MSNRCGGNHSFYYMKSSLLPQELLDTLGVLDWGYTEESIPRSFNHYSDWTGKGLHGPLGYLADHRKDLRKDLKNVSPDFQSALVFLFSYQAAKKWMLENDHHEVAAYTLGYEGEDYHHALKRRLQKIADHLGVKSLISLDIQPVLERDLAFRAGLGWFGKNSMLIGRKHGSYFIIGSLLLDQKLPLPQGTVDTDHCGQCMVCAEACPTLAIDPQTRTLVAEKCISAFTIEIMKDAPPPVGFENARGEIFGCDICQDVCPWNKKPLLRVTSALKLQDRFMFLKTLLFETPKGKLKELISAESGRGWRKKLFGTPFDRPGKEGWLKNLKIFGLMALLFLASCSSPDKRVNRIFNDKLNPLFNDPRIQEEMDKGSEYGKAYAYFLTQQGIKHLDLPDLVTWHKYRIKMASLHQAYCASLMSGKLKEEMVYEAFGTLSDDELNEVADLMVKGAMRKLNNKGSPRSHVSFIQEGFRTIMEKSSSEDQTKLKKLFAEVKTAPLADLCWGTLHMMKGINDLPDDKKILVLKALMGI